MRRALVSSKKKLSGKLFVEFALIYLSYVKKQMQDSNLFIDYTIQQLFDKLDIIEYFKSPGNKLHIGKVLSKQKQLYLNLGVAPPVSYEKTPLYFTGNLGCTANCFHLTMGLINARTVSNVQAFFYVKLSALSA